MPIIHAETASVTTQVIYCSPKSLTLEPETYCSIQTFYLGNENTKAYFSDSPERQNTSSKIIHK